MCLPRFINSRFLLYDDSTRIMSYLQKVKIEIVRVYCVVYVLAIYQFVTQFCNNAKCIGVVAELRLYFIYKNSYTQAKTQ